MRTRILVVAAGVLALTVLVGPTALAGRDPKPGMGKDGAPVTLRDLQGVNFVSQCRFSHRAPDDPIVFPGQPGASHDHSFVGNRTTNASSTLGSLLSGGTTCHRAGDTAGYWMPTLIANGVPTAPLGATIYYRRRTLAPVRAFPPDFRMIAGDARAAGPQDLRVAFWNCGVEGGVPPSSAPPACPEGRGRELRLHVTFPSCWDGKRRDSADHKSHVAYPMQGRCPSTHPFAVPQITLIYRYPVRDGSTVGLASGGPYTAHADFLNAWKNSELRRLVDHCLNALRHCQTGS
jgi:Domain of unknown function (DUF1996)